MRRLREKLPLLGDALVTVKQFGYKLLERATHDRGLTHASRLFSAQAVPRRAVVGR